MKLRNLLEDGVIRNVVRWHPVGDFFYSKMAELAHTASDLRNQWSIVTWKQIQSAAAPTRELMIADGLFELPVWTRRRGTSHADIHRSRQIGRERGGHYDYCMWWCCYFFDATPSRSLDNITNHFLPRFVSLSLTIVRSGGGHQTQNLPRAFPVSWFVWGNHALREEKLVVCPPWTILFW